MNKFLIQMVFFGFMCVFLAALEGKATELKHLDGKQQSIIAISAFTANGNLERLKPALARGLDAGLTINEIKEILVQLYAYAGFPRSLNSINTFMQLLHERQKNGIQDTIGKEASPMPADMDRNHYGAETRAKLRGQSEIAAPAGFQIFAPVIDNFLKEHLFADIFYRDNIDWQSRELATISALAALSGTEGQQRYHLNAAMNMGLTADQLREFISVIDSELGKERATSSANILDSVLKTRNQ